MKNLWRSNYALPWLGINIQPNILLADALQWTIRAAVATATFWGVTGALGR